MKVEQVLVHLGYSEAEVQIYLAALTLSEATVSELSHKVGMPRTTVQEVLEHMLKKGLLTSYTKHSHRYWVAENPEKLFISLQEREAALKEVLPQLQAIRHQVGDKPQVKVFQGVDEIKLIMDDIIESKHHISALISWDDWIGFFGQEYVKDFIERRYKHFLRIRMITPKTQLTEKLKRKDEAQLRQTRYLPGNVDLKRISNFIYGNKIAIISLNKKEPTGILIEDAGVVHGNTLYFENLWQSSAQT